MDEYHSTDEKKYSEEEYLMIDRLMATEILNKEAFVNQTTYADKKYRVFIRGQGYPLTPRGEKEFNKNWYLEFRNSMLIVVIRDFLTVVAFIFSLYLTYLKVFQSSP